MVIAFISSVILTVASLAALVLFSGMVAYVWQRRPGRIRGWLNLVLAGLIVPPAIVPTIFVLQKLGLFKTMPGLILIEIAYGLPFCILLFAPSSPASRGSWTRLRWSTERTRCRSPSG